MANHKSALKRVRQDEIRRLRNKSTKTRIKNVVKDIRATASNNENKESLSKELNTAKSIIDKAAKKGVIHKRTAARKISRLSKLIPS
ncbi:MAG: 30S ribosomal protein S20 [Proteobacteria bacterium]|nr:30S ribosomal protein S20 [Pseudomonadota bacterium]